MLKPLILVILVLANVVVPARILLIPSPEPERLHSFLATAKTLQEHGKLQSHWTWIVLPQYYMPLLDAKNMSVLSFKTEEFTAATKRMADASNGPKKGNLYNYMNILRSILPDYGQICKDLMNHVPMRLEIEKHNFDLAIVDGNEGFSCGYLLAAEYSLPYITMSETFNPWSLGISTTSSSEPAYGYAFSNRMSFTERFRNTFAHLSQMRAISSARTKGLDHLCSEDDCREYYSYYDLYKKSELWLINQDGCCLEYPRMYGPHIKFIGALSTIQLTPYTDLPEDVHEYIDRATQGLVVVHLEPTTPGYEHIFQLIADDFMKGFGKLRQKVIMKCKSSDYSWFPENVKCVDDLDLHNILTSTHIVAFITHGSSRHHMMAAQYGVPVLSLPVTDLQKYYGKRSEARGYGISIECDSFTADDIVAAMLVLSSNEKYRDKSRKCAQIINSLPSPQDELIMWVDYIITHGGSHLKPQSLDMSYRQLMNMDVVIVLCFICSIITILSLLMCVIIYQRCKKQEIFQQVENFVRRTRRRSGVGLTSIFTNDIKDETKSE